MRRDAAFVADSAVPTEHDVAEARRLICDALLGDFPFAGPGDPAAAVALLLLPFVRDRVDGATPLHLFDSPQPGSGKTLLADVIAIPALGTEPAATTEVANADDLREWVTAMAVAGDPVVLIDNVNARLGGSALAAALTKVESSDRVVGTSRLAKQPMRCLWLATGNNVAMTPELARRVVRCRIDAGVARPHLSGGFRQADLPKVPKSLTDFLALLGERFRGRHGRCVAAVLLLDATSRQWSSAVPAQRCARDAACWSAARGDFPDFPDAALIAGSFQTRVLSSGERPADCPPPHDGVHLVHVTGRGDAPPEIWCFVRAAGHTRHVPAADVVVDDVDALIDQARPRLTLTRPEQRRHTIRPASLSRRHDAPPGTPNRRTRPRSPSGAASRA